MGKRKQKGGGKGKLKPEAGGAAQAETRVPGLSARLEIAFRDEGEAGNALRALEQETEFRKRAESRLGQEGAKLFVEIGADDVVALRAALNSYLRLVQVIKGIEGD